MITVEHLRKHYRVHSREAGVWAAFRSVFFRRYDVIKAVDDISFTIGRGERVGFLGPNGAGKTTTLKVLSGLLVPTGGAVHVGGFDPSRRERDFLVSIMLVAGQKNQLLWDLPPVDTFELNRAIYGIPRAEFRERLDELVELLGIAEVSRKPTRQLSLGERMKCELAAALLHRPTVLFLDEPTIGLDVTMQANVRRFIKTYNERYGATILLTSHNMGDVAEICERVILIDKGRLLYDGSLPELVRRTTLDKRVTFHFGAEVATARLAAFGRVLEAGERRASVQVPQRAVQDVVQVALRDLPVVDLTIEDPPLEEVLAVVFANGAGERVPAGSVA